MSAATLILAFDTVNQTLVPSFQGSSGSLPQFRQANYRVRVYLVQPLPNSLPGQPSYQVFPDSGAVGFRMGIWSDSTGTLDDSDDFKLVFTGETGWTQTTDDDDIPCFEGNFNCRTTELAAALGAGQTGRFYFAAGFTQDGELQPVFDQFGGAENVTVNSSTDDGSAAPVSVINNTYIFPSPFGIKNLATGKISLHTVDADGNETISII